MNKPIVPMIKEFSMLTEEEKLEMLKKAGTDSRTGVYVMPHSSRDVIRYSFIKIEGETPRVFIYDFKQLNQNSNYDDFFNADVTNIFRDGEDRPMNALFTQGNRRVMMFGENYRNPAGSSNKPAEYRAELLHKYEIFYDNVSEFSFNDRELLHYIITGYSTSTIEMLMMALQYEDKPAKSTVYG